MKFAVHSLTRKIPRIGKLIDINGKPDVTLETPLVMLHTQGGQVPHLTHEVLKLVSREPHVLQIPLVSMHNFKEAMVYFNGAITDFIGSKHSISCLTLQDPSNLTQQGHHLKGKIPIWTRNGKAYYDSELYMETVEASAPDMYCLLSDGDTNQSSPQKRIAKAVENTILFHNECLKRHRSSEVLKNSFVIAPIAGGYNLKARQKCIREFLKDDGDVGGYLIDGFHNNGPEVEFVKFEDVSAVLECVIDEIPESKLRVVQGCWNPLTVIKMVQLGIDVFDTSYCRMLTERSAAMVFPIEIYEEQNAFEINLRQIRYIDDFQPILAGCMCPTCKKYSRGYIHHLLTVQELLGPVLIMIHNVYHYLRFFSKIRDSIKNDNLRDLERRIEIVFRQYQQDILMPQKEAVASDLL